jgi:DnaJ-domain-containing protein 1
MPKSILFFFGVFTVIVVAVGIAVAEPLMVAFLLLAWAVGLYLLWIIILRFQSLRQTRSRRRRDYEQPHRQRERSRQSRSTSDGGKSQGWWLVLGTAPDATFEIAKEAYLLKIQQYHPDKVAGLGPEFVQLAEQKSKELNAALEQAKRSSRT